MTLKIAQVAGDDHGQRRVAGRRHQGDRHRDQLHGRRADEDPDLARSVRADARRCRASSSIASTSAATRPASSPTSRRRARARRTRSGRWTGSTSPTWRPPARRRATTTTTTSRRSRSRRPARTSSSRTGGMGLNLVVKRGTNQFHGGVRGYFDNHAMESTNVPDELARRRRDAGDRRITTSRSPTTASTSAARSSRTRPGSTARTRCRTCSWSGAPARWSTRRS